MGLRKILKYWQIGDKQARQNSDSTSVNLKPEANASTKPQCSKTLDSSNESSDIKKNGFIAKLIRMKNAIKNRLVKKKWFEHIYQPTNEFRRSISS